MTVSTRKRRAIGIIPARYASSRFPAKALALIAGVPMIQRVYEAASQSRLLDTVVVATDDPRIADVVTACGGKVVMPEGCFASGTERVAAAARAFPHDVIINVQGDLPSLPPAMIDQLVAPLLEQPDLPCATLARRVTSVDELHDRTLARVILDREHYALYFTRATVPFVKEEPDPNRWLEHTPYYRHIGLYGFQRDFLQTFVSLGPSPLEQAEGLEQLRILEHGYRMQVFLTEQDVYPVDVPEDVDFVEKQFGQ